MVNGKTSAMYTCLLYCVLVIHTEAQPTSTSCAVNDNASRLLFLEEQTHSVLISIDNSMKEQNAGIKCRERNDGKRSCYKFVRSPVNWQQARKYCQSLKGGADLVSIESEVEQIFLADIILELYRDCGRFHTSGRKVFGGSWVWQATGKPFSYAPWAPRQPDNSGDGMQLWNNPGGWMTWDDYLYTHKTCFICEYL